MTNCDYSSHANAGKGGRRKMLKERLMYSVSRMKAADGESALLFCIKIPPPLKVKCNLVCALEARLTSLFHFPIDAC